MGGIRTLFSEAEIAARVETLAVQIARTIPGDFVMVGLFFGARRCFSLTSLAPWTEPGPGTTHDESRLQARNTFELDALRAVNSTRPSPFWRA